jgi:GNAT superfamily N-acetyltransferase
MVENWEVQNTEMADLPKIFELFEQSIKYQEQHGYPVWKNYDKNAIINDIETKNQYKVAINSKTAIVFSVCYTDKIIWRHHENGDSIYLHRIVVNPAFKGQKLFGIILEWVTTLCQGKGIKNIRMDTWQANPTIVNYYQGFGFHFVENFTTPDSTDLPVHNRNLALTLLEYKIE